MPIRGEINTADKKTINKRIFRFLYDVTLEFTRRILLENKLYFPDSLNALTTHLINQFSTLDYTALWFSLRVID